jgi:hypothetical protein
MGLRARPEDPLQMQLSARHTEGRSVNPDLTTARGLLEYAALLEKQTARILAYPGVTDRKKQS